MKAEILAVGTELLMGQIANTNAQYISSRLPDAGIGVYFHDVVGDNPERLRQSFQLAMSRSDVIILTGGLGPTRDDITKEIVSEVLGRKLVPDQESLDKLDEFFRKRNKKMTQNNLKQAYFPEGCTIIRNSNGTAPGCIIEDSGKTIVLLPGPPSELKPMFEETVMPYLASKSEYRLESVYVRIFGIGEAEVEDRLLDLIDGQTNPTIAPYAKDGEVMLRITVRYPNEGTGTDLIGPVVEEIRKRLGDSVYSTDNSSLGEVAAKLLMEKKMTVSLAESCTGGLLAAKLTDFPGISEVFDRAAVTYSNRAKVEELGVRQETLEKYGAVSEQTATEMAVGIKNVSGTDIGISVTGIAGPGGGTTEKPVGLVYAALAHRDGVIVKRLSLMGDRAKIRNLTCLHVFDMIRRYLLGIGN
ncbi:MAG TPA: competence/damage-inducible protein A [Clostridiales bacterium]|nr:competence/damage-inducible protein A [Clostridiales bacterium]HPV02429.1 competence/damage-inducible protein A [Clostridiales bacterium]